MATKAAGRYVYEGAWSERRARWFFCSVYRWLLRAHADGDLCFAEKSPQNCFLVGFLSRAFPDCRFVHVIRDGRDAAVSYSKKPWLQASSAGSGRYEPGGYPHGPYARYWIESERRREFETTSDVHRCIWAWRRFTEAALAGVDSLERTRHYELRYEDFLESPDEVSERLLDYLEITGSAARAAFLDRARDARTDSIGNWRRELSSSDAVKVEEEAGSLLRKLGYVEEMV